MIQSEQTRHSEDFLPTLYLHIGSEKTGTTAIAKTLTAAQNILLSEGCLFPILDGADHRTTPDHAALAAAILDDNALQLYSLLKIIREQITPKVRTVILTSELFFHLFDDSKFTREAIGQIRSWAAELGFRFEVIAYLRSQDEVLASLHNQRVKWDALSQSFDKWAALMWQRYDYMKIIENWSNACDAISLHLYTAAAINGDVVDHFLPLIGIAQPIVADIRSLDAFNETERSDRVYIEKNMSLSTEANYLMRAVLDAAPGLASSISEMLFDYGDAEFYRQPFEPINDLNPEIRAQVLERYRSSNAQLAQQWNIGVPGQLFPSPSYETIESVDIAKSMKLLSRLCVGVLSEKLALKAMVGELTPGIISPGLTEYETWFPIGWCKPEGWGAWTLATEAEILMRFVPGCDWVHLLFDCAGFVHGDHVQDVRVLFDAAHVADWRFDATTVNQTPELTLHIDPTIELHRLRLTIPTARSPLSLGLSADHRPLGLGLRQLEIRTRLQSVRSKSGAA